MHFKNLQALLLMISYTSVKLDSINSEYPYDASSIDPKNISLVTFSNVKSINNAIAYIVLIYSNPEKNKQYTITEHLQVPIELACTGFNFISPDLNSKQEIKFDYQSFV